MHLKQLPPLFNIAKLFEHTEALYAGHTPNVAIQAVECEQGGDGAADVIAGCVVL